MARKAVVKPVDLFEEINTESCSQLPLPNAAKFTVKPKCTCALCNDPIYTSPFIIRLTALTGRALWHRSCNAEQLSLCEKCSMELNEYIDKWLIKKNPKLKKFSD